MKEGEPRENEKNPEQAVSDAINSIENKDAADPVISSTWMNKAKNYTKTSAEIAGISLAAGLFVAGKTLLGILKFAKKAVEKGGNIGFKEGYEIGKDVFSFEGKKDKK